jgi:hypothetical protein
MEKKRKQNEGSAKRKRLYLEIKNRVKEIIETPAFLIQESLQRY